MQRWIYILKLLGNDIRLVMKTEGFVLFWMVEHDYYLGESPKWKEFQRCEVASHLNKLWPKR